MTTTTMTSRAQTAITILDQLTNAPPGKGPSRVVMMLGARNISHTPKGVTFMFSGSRDFNGAKIDLNGSDTYDLTLGKYSVKGFKEEIHEGLYFDNLGETFEAETGLRVSL